MTATTEIPLLVVGYDFRMASSAMREVLVTADADREYLFEAIRKIDPSAGFLVLETCNRLEWMVSTGMADWIAGILEAWMLDKWQRAFPEIKNLPGPYIYKNREAVIHVLRVVVGMESLATGEAQIAGQFHSALKRAQAEKTTTPIINRLGHIAGRIAKSGTKIGFRSNYRQGIHGLVVKYIDRHFDGNVRDRKILVAGMGEIGRRAAHLIEETFGCIVVPVNRTVNPEREGKWVPLAQLAGAAADADVLVVATGGSVAIIDETNLNLKDRTVGDRQWGAMGKLLIMDIGIPRQVTEGLQKHEKVDYRNIDHLMDLTADEEKHTHMDELEAEIQKEYMHFKRFCQGREMSDLLAGIHSGRLELTEELIPAFVESQLADLDELRRKKIENAMKQFIRDYSNRLFDAFHETMEKYWSSNGH